MALSGAARDAEQRHAHLRVRHTPPRARRTPRAPRRSPIRRPAIARVRRAFRPGLTLATPVSSPSPPNATPAPRDSVELSPYVVTRKADGTSTTADIPRERSGGWVPPALPVVPLELAPQGVRVQRAPRRARGAAERAQQDLPLRRELLRAELARVDAAPDGQRRARRKRARAALEAAAPEGSAWRGRAAPRRTAAPRTCPTPTTAPRTRTEAVRDTTTTERSRMSLRAGPKSAVRRATARRRRTSGTCSSSR